MSAPDDSTDKVPDDVPELTPDVAGVRRVSWSRTLQERDGEQAAARVRAVVAEALQGGTHRVEALVDPDDPLAHRVATWAGLRREGLARGVAAGADRLVLARLAADEPLDTPGGFRALLNSFLPRKRAIAQLLVVDAEDRVLLCQLTYKQDWDLPGGVVEVAEAPRDAAGREVLEELALDLPAGDLLLTDWLPPWGGWDDALCLVFDGGLHAATVLDDVVREVREIRDVAFCTPEQVRERCADFTARRVEAALTARGTGGPAYAESGRV